MPREIQKMALAVLIFSEGFGKTQMHTNSVQPSFTLREKLKFPTIRDAEGSNIFKG